jgi:hypothetical protein
MKTFSLSIILLCATTANPQCVSKITPNDKIRDVQKKLDCLSAENMAQKTELDRAKLSRQFALLLAQFPSTPSPLPYTFATYNNDLHGLANLLLAFVAFFQSNPEAKISDADKSLFFSGVLVNVDVARIRACQGLPVDQYYLFHCRDNFSNFETVLDHLEIDLNSSNDRRLSIDKIGKNQQEISSWLGFALVTAGKP